MVLGIFSETGEELERLTLPTLTPDETVPPMSNQDRKQKKRKGKGSGLIALDRKSVV